MSVYITGDLHGDFSRFHTDEFKKTSPSIRKGDYLIITGDFSVIVDRRPSFRELVKKFQASSLPFTILFIDGNHENHDRLAALPVSEWNGGLVHRITPSIIHLMRGQIYTIEGKKYFTFGGARSHDLPEGPLYRDDPQFEEKREDFERRGVFYRIAYEDWWPTEMPTDEEYAEGLRNLEKHGGAVDYIITHCCASSVQEKIYRGHSDPDELTEYLEGIRSTVSFSHWYFGHYHSDSEVSESETLVHRRIISLYS